MAKIFISYRRADSQQVSGRIHDRLVQAFGKRDIFKDVDDIPPGMDFRGVLREATANCDVMLVVIGPKWLDIGDSSGQRRLDDPNDFVRIEVETGLQRSGTRVIPVLVEGAVTPAATDLPNSLKNLAYANAFTLHNDPIFNRDLDTLIRQLRGMLSHKRQFDWRWLVGPTVLIAIAAALILSQLGSGSETSTTTTPTTAVAAASTDQTITALAQPTQTLTQPSASATPTLEIRYIVETLDAQATEESATQFALETAAARATEYAIGTQSRIDQTATATRWTDTPTPDITASIEAYRTQQAATITQAWIDSWTHTPTSTFTPTTTLTPTITFTPSPTSIPTITANDQWTPIVRAFDAVEMALVPPGCFMMGSENGDSDEQPVHENCFDAPFWIDRYEVTNAQYGSSGNWSGDNRPRDSVNWYNASAHCLNRKARLPNEAEWEYAARGPDNLIYPWGNEFDDDNVTYLGNSNQETALMSSRLGGASWVGIYDLSGNVWEWVSTFYINYPYENNSEISNNYLGEHVLRGGSWGNTISDLRAANRSRNAPARSLNNVGFRCARDYVEGDLS